MTPDDGPAVGRLASDAFADLAVRQGVPPADSPLERFALRNAHLARTDPGGSWVAEDEDGTLLGASIACLREGVWGLSLLVAHPRRQSAGVGRELLARATAYGLAGARGGIIVASRDPRAVRLYVRAGFRLEPAMGAAGTPRGVARPPDVRDGGPDDLELTAPIDRAIRGGARVGDLALELRTGARLLLCEDRGYAVVRETEVETLAALDDAAARSLLRAALAAAPGVFTVDSLTARQQWAVEESVAAGLQLAADGPKLVRGDPGPLTPYIPCGPWL